MRQTDKRTDRIRPCLISNPEPSSPVSSKRLVIRPGPKRVVLQVCTVLIMKVGYRNVGISCPLQVSHQNTRQDGMQVYKHGTP